MIIDNPNVQEIVQAREVFRFLKKRNGQLVLQENHFRQNNKTGEFIDDWRDVPIVEAEEIGGMFR